MNTTNNFTFQPVTRERWQDFEALFEGRGGPKHCWCMVFRAMSSADRRAGARAKKDAMCQRISNNVPVGILAYDDDQPVAWCSIAPIETYTNLRTRTYRPTEDEPESVWSIACLFIRAAYRRQGMMTHLIHAAIEYARENGAQVIEAYPVPFDSPTYRYMGYIPIFEAIGFKEIGMAGSRRHIMRLRL